MRKIKCFSGSSHPELSALILERLGLPAAPATVKRFANQELVVDLGCSVRDEDVFIIQSGSTSTNDHLFELLIMINACKIASARRITAVLPYFPYNKQSKKKKPRGAITAKLVGNMLAVAGVDHIITLDLHSSQIQGFFNKPVDNLVAEPTIARFIREQFPNYEQGVVICKNAGGAKRVTSLADRLNMDFALIHRERYHVQQEHARPAGTTRLTLVGDVQGKVCFMVDDIIDGTHSFLDAAEHLKRCGASHVFVIATHGILSDAGVFEIEANAAVDGLIVTNSYPISAEKVAGCRKLRMIDISGTLAEAIRRTHNGESISYLFNTAI
ncbi:hypothetical protein CXG81DRAFT_8820 [Caulochytrium protostelioides]|uniref:ribose-phosphate diphosphokinase n=1 Tax=Caulochytrium protostelioides TaxID=1555241 RepID=A0A4P9XEL7_9FUNG|nr:hypothetical protein CXG81DRAFT_8820 [Caulochytrium protostelioides]|eukprot:RKP03994.1 hypothetical protein CXG81DRAFT_8820 [Caulochytrium protostelioides]